MRRNDTVEINAPRRKSHGMTGTLTNKPYPDGMVLVLLSNGKSYWFNIKSLLVI